MVERGVHGFPMTVSDLLEEDERMEALIRVGTFLGVLTAMLLWEGCYPRRPLSRPRQERWVTNLGLTLLNTVLVHVTVAGVAYTTAVFAADQGVGLLHWHPLPAWAAAVVTLLVLDFAIYLQHVLFHAVPLLWRLHRVHHADLDVDATTGLRFHPLEILLSLGYKAAVVVLLGALPWTVVAFEVLLNAASVFNHGNVALPERLDCWLRWIVVTPDMHRVHHSTCVVETNANFGFAVSWWDRLCGTYRAQPVLGQVGMDLGLSDYRAPFTLGQLVLWPLRGGAGRSTSAGSRPGRAPEGEMV
jgi:sterol desaturase/sphingolipid hydroxylase (fatty acid hydroxylase superfamily)